MDCTFYYDINIQLGSVPYAYEAQVAHNAQAVGKYSEITLDEYFSNACAEGSYLRGWSGTSPICQSDESGEGGTSTYTAGYGIVINGEEISFDQSIDFYIAGSGIEIDGKTISIDVNSFAPFTHTHNEYYHKTESDDRYYNKADLYTKDDLYTKTDVYTKTEIDNDIYKKSDVYTKTQIDDNYYTKSISDNRYHLKSGDLNVEGNITLTGRLTASSGQKIVYEGELPGGQTWGSWRGWRMCPHNSYVCGIEQRVEGNQGDGDDTAVNNIKIRCCSIGE